MSGGVERPDADVAGLITAPIEASHNVFGAGVNNVPTARIGSDVAALPATDGVPILAPDHSVVVHTGDGDGGVILLGSVDVIRKAIVGNHVIELCGRLILLCGPGLAPVV